jgi:DNA-binding transcriptional LysR family regulator
MAMLEWDQLRFMLAIHRRGSMQAAAEDLRVDRATVLRRLDALEAALGAKLFDRRRDGCKLTPAGLGIIETVEGIEQATTALAARVGGEDRRAEGIVPVTVPEFFAVKVLCPALPRLRASHPGISIEIRTGHGFLNLARGEADIALRNRRPEHRSLVARRVGMVGIGLYATRDYLDRRGTPNGDFSGHDMVLFDETLGGMPGAAWVEEQALAANVAMRSNEILPLLASTKSGLGIGCIPAVAAHGDPELVPVPPGIVGKPEIFLITHRDLRRKARVRVVFDFIVRLCSEQAGALSGRAVAESFGDRKSDASFTPRRPPTPSGLSRARPGS